MSQKYRFHILGLPHTVTNSEYTGCAYTQKVLKFGKMMKARGHEIIHYGHEDSTVDVTKNIKITDNSDLIKYYGEDYITKKSWNDHSILSCL